MNRYGRFRSSEPYAECTPLWVKYEVVLPERNVLVVFSFMKLSHFVCHAMRAGVNSASVVSVSVRTSAKSSRPASVFGLVVRYRMTICI